MVYVSGGSKVRYRPGQISPLAVYTGARGISNGVFL